MNASWNIDFLHKNATFSPFHILEHGVLQGSTLITVLLNVLKETAMVSEHFCLLKWYLHSDFWLGECAPTSSSTRSECSTYSHITLLARQKKSVKRWHFYDNLQRKHQQQHLIYNIYMYRICYEALHECRFTFWTVNTYHKAVRLINNREKKSNCRLATMILARQFVRIPCEDTFIRADGIVNRGLFLPNSLVGKTLHRSRGST